MIADDVKRLNFYEKQFLSVRDFQDEQDYHIEQRRRHHIAHHLWGVVFGLEIVQDAGSQIWSLRPGMAVDGYGREILVFDPEPLDTQRIESLLLSANNPARLNVWLAYRTEKSNRPAPNFVVCDAGRQFMRVRETFRVIYQDDPPFDLQPATGPGNQNPANPATWPRATNDLPDDPSEARWPVYLGTLTWDTAQKLITAVSLTDSAGQKRRRYVGAVADEIEGPNNRLLVRGRGNPSPLPTDPSAAGFAGVPVTVEGSLRVERQLTAAGDLSVLGKLGVGFSTEPDVKAQVKGGSAATLNEGTGYLVLGDVGGKNLVLDDAALMARNNKAPSRLDLQGRGGDLVVHGGKAGAEFVITDAGSVGVGTAAPTQLVTLSAPEGSRLEIARVSASLPWSKTNGTLNPGAFVINQQSQGSAQPGADLALMRDGKKRLLLGDTDTFISSQEGGSLRFFVNHEEANPRECMTITSVGNVGVGITPPVARLDVADGGAFVRHPLGGGQAERGLEVGSQGAATAGTPNGRIGFPGYGVQHGQIRWMPAFGGSGRFDFIDSSPGSPSGDYGGSPGLVGILAKTGMFQSSVGIGTQQPEQKLSVAGAMSVDQFDQNDGLVNPGVTFGSNSGEGVASKRTPGGNRFGLDLYTLFEPRLSITQGGNVGINTTNPAFLLDVNGDLTVRGAARKPGGGNWTSLSDARLKRNVSQIGGALEKLLALRGVTFEWIDPEKAGNQTGEQLGMIAQEVEKVFPQWVGTDPEGFKELTISGFEALAVEALRELRAKDAELEGRIQSLETKAAP